MEVLGEDPAAAGEEWRSRTGVVLQSWRDHPRWTPRRLLDHLGRYYVPYSTPERPRPRDVEELLDRVGLTEHADQKIVTLSGGQRRRLDVAIGIIGRPELLFLDEPTAGFDPASRAASSTSWCNALAELEDTTILLTTHDLDEAEKLADRILILAAGRIVADGGADELAHQAARESQVKWSRRGQRFEQATTDVVAFVRGLLAQHDDIDDLEVRRASLEDTYLTMVQEHETVYTVEVDGDPRWRCRTMEATTMNPQDSRDPSRPPARLGGVHTEPS